MRVKQVGFENGAHCKFSKMESWKAVVSDLWIANVSRHVIKISSLATTVAFFKHILGLLFPM